MTTKDLLPPPSLILENGIGHEDNPGILADFDAIGRGLVAELIRDGLKPTHHVLDVGCGLGTLGASFGRIPVYRLLQRARCARWSSIEWCQREYAELGNFRFTHANVFNTHYNPEATQRAADYRFPFDAAQFDFIFSTSLFTHLLLADARNYIRQMVRVLAPRGKMWNTFFLLDEISTPLARTSAPLNVRMAAEVEGGLVVVPHDPEAVIGLYTSLVVRSHLDYGLINLDIRNGTWSGRQDDLRASYQDVIVAIR